MPKDKKKNGLAKSLQGGGKSTVGTRAIGWLGRTFGGASGTTTRKITDGRGSKPKDRFNKKSK